MWYNRLVVEEDSKKIVIIQFPNIYLWTMAVTWFIGYFSTGLIHSTSRAVFITSGIIWSYEEIVHGASWIRRTLGVIVIIVLILNIIKG